MSMPYLLLVAGSGPWYIFLSKNPMCMKNQSPWILLISLFLALPSAAQNFTAGNFVVYRVGTGLSTLTAAAAPVFLDEFTPAGVLVQSVALPTAVSGSNNILTAAGIGVQEGMVTLSFDGQYLVLTGYNAATGTAAIAITSSAVVSRTVGTVRYDNLVNTTTSLTDLSSGAGVTSAVSNDGLTLWATGTGNLLGQGGIRSAVLGATTSTKLNATGTVIRSLIITHSQLYATQNVSGPRFSTVGTGTPTTTGQTLTAMPGLPTIGTPGQFVLFDLTSGGVAPDVIYFTDNNNGIEKYCLFLGTWLFCGQVGIGTDGYKGLAATFNGTSVTLMATRNGSNTSSVGGGELVSLVDASGFLGTLSGTPVHRATAATNDTKAFRGVALAPVMIVVLPIKILSFTASETNRDVMVNWSTETGINFSHFEVEHSLDGMIFTRAGQVDLSGTGDTRQDYQFIDKSIADTASSGNKLFYRLKLVDKDGKSEYSKTVTVALTVHADKVINAYPNPFTSRISVNLSQTNAGKANISLTDVNGKKLRNWQFSLPAGQSRVSLTQLGNLPKGAYLLLVNIDNTVSTLYLVK